VPSLIDHAAACATQPAAAGRRAGPDQRQANSHAAVLVSLLGRVDRVRAGQHARHGLQCIARRLDAGGLRASAPLLRLLLALLSYAGHPAAPAGCPRVREQGLEEQQQQRGEGGKVGDALVQAVVDTPMLLEALQHVYARRAWHLPAAEMLSKLRGTALGRRGGRLVLQGCWGWLEQPLPFPTTGFVVPPH
jgi:hypothetical protein